MVVELVAANGVGPTVAAAERRLVSGGRASLDYEVAFSDDLLRAALKLSEAVGDLYSLIHAAGMIAAMRRELTDDETIESVSLGAGPSGACDLVTNRRVAEFKFQHWRSSNNAARQRELTADVVRLALDDSGKPRYLYLLDTSRPLAWLASNRRNLDKLLRSTRHAGLLPSIRRAIGEVVTVQDVWDRVGDEITVKSLRKLAPEVFGASGAT